MPSVYSRTSTRLKPVQVTAAVRYAGNSLTISGMRPCDPMAVMAAMLSTLEGLRDRPPADQNE
eukprot:5366431-Prymnesium_polylepis.1